MKNAIITAAAAFTVLIAGPPAQAAHLWEDSGGWFDDHFTYQRGSGPLFRAGEITVDLFASYQALQRGFEDVFETNIRDGDWGGGAGINYFFSPHLGIGTDLNIGDNGGAFVDQALANVFLRLPIESIRSAPYIFGGGGGGFQFEDEWLWHGGVGYEFRFNHTTGIFADARYIWAEKTEDRLLLRAGIRFAL